MQVAAADHVERRAPHDRRGCRRRAPPPGRRRARPTTARRGGAGRRSRRRCWGRRRPQPGSRTGSSARSTRTGAERRERLVVRRDREPVGRLPARVRRDAVCVAGGGDGVEAGGAQPRLDPAADVAVGRVVEGADEVGEGGVAEPVPREVAVDPGQEVVVAEPGDELSQRRVALGVGDRVEVVERGVDVRHVLGQRRDRVGRPPLVGDVGVGLAADARSRRSCRGTRPPRRRPGTPCSRRRTPAARCPPTRSSWPGRRTTCGPSRGAITVARRRRSPSVGVPTGRISSR